MIRTKHPVDKFVGKQIRIIKNILSYRIHRDLFVGSLHTIVAPLGITPNSIKGVWVLIHEEIIYLARHEFEYHFKN